MGLLHVSDDGSWYIAALGLSISVCKSVKYPPHSQAGWATRGGSWNNSTDNVRSAIRNRNHPNNRNNNLGFRLLLGC
ncbi:MAG: hypothetical protein BWK73_40835 [Thiothrix lacustris]|uniref:Sulfatase-modifying factor enzyme-like domain-containing protein n=1 Tax=Thiothrix lacustris TaxID=525917 RepID=A0A1Y1QD61_9GAMM|nr:MAG: hypothetical protein BWK73_40835 [Thiothrix lacustris]